MAVAREQNDLGVSGTTSTKKSAFTSLPDEIIQHILQSSDPSTFASLVLLNRTWRRVSQQAQLYALQLSRCPSYVQSHTPITWPVSDEKLALYRQMFAQEVKRNLLPAYLRPQETLIQLVSTTISSSSAFPGGEAFHFAFSSSGHYVLAYSSSRIHVLHVADSELTVERELKILRRPASISIIDDGTRLAVLSTDHQVDVYDLSDEKPKHIDALALDHHPRTISLSPCGSVLAAAYDGGIEVYSLAASPSSTDKRGVKSDAVDSLVFSRDGTQLLGTTSHSKRPSTVVLTAPYFNPGEHDPEHAISQLWSTSILFPHSSRDCSHALLLPNHGDYDVNWAFTFDRMYETFRTVRIDDLRNGTTYFTGPVSNSSKKLLPSTLPASTVSGDLVAAAFHGHEIWCYGVPENLDISQQRQQNIATEPRSPLSINAPLENPESPTAGGNGEIQRNSDEKRVPKWQILSENPRNQFIGGRNVSSMEGLSALKWITTSQKAPCERLIAAAPGGVGDPSGFSFGMDDSGMGTMDGGRLLLLDFRYSIMNGQKRTMTIEVGDKEPHVLEEEHRDLEAEVAIVRRRTVAQTRAHQQLISRSSTTAAHSGRSPGHVFARGDPMPPLPRVPSTRKVPLAPMEERSETSSIVSVDEQEAMDAPYAHGAPRSGTTLRRAATAAAQTVRYGQPQAPRLRAPGGRGELPDESDADNWVPPPPPYTADPVPALPDHFKDAATFNPASSAGLRRSSTQRSSVSGDMGFVSGLQRSRTTFSHSSRPFSVTASQDIARPDSSSSAVSAASAAGPDSQSSAPAASADGFGDLYDVTPQGSPELQSASPVTVSPLASIASPERVTRQPITPQAPLSLTIPEIPVLNIKTAEPVSPRPRHAALSSAVQNISSITEQQWDGVNAAQPLQRSTTPGGSSVLTQSRLDAAMPPRPNDDHRITDLPPISPIVPVASDESPTDHERPGMSSESSPPRPPSRGGSDIIDGGYSLPSASQLTRLNSRSGRPNARLIDPSRRNSGPFSSSPSDLSQFDGSQQFSHMNTEPHMMQQGPPRAAAGAYQGAPPNPSPYPPYQDLQNSYGRGRGLSAITVSPHMRPEMVRLETIHSVGSVTDNYENMASIAAAVRPVPVGVSRNGSRAERSAAINVAEAKKKGWRGTTKRKKVKKDGDETSTAGWTDVASEAAEIAEGKKKKDGANKCTVM